MDANLYDIDWSLLPASLDRPGNAVSEGAVHAVELDLGISDCSRNRAIVVVLASSRTAALEPAGAFQWFLEVPETVQYQSLSNHAAFDGRPICCVGFESGSKAPSRYWKTIRLIRQLPRVTRGPHSSRSSRTEASPAGKALPPTRVWRTRHAEW